MKLNDILKSIENTTPESLERTGHRRDVLKNIGTKLAAATIPVVASSFFNKAQAKTTDILSEAIVFALTGTNMLIAFYTKALNTTGLITGDAVVDFTTILNHTTAHRDYWNNVLITTGTTPPVDIQYDFTAKNALPKVFADYTDFLAVAHTLQDAAVRIYAQAIFNISVNKALRGDAINIRCTMARHAGHIRLLARNAGTDIYPWVTNADANSIVGELIQGYQGDELTMQQKYEIVNINGSAITMKAATEAFDEPMGVLAAQAFIAKFTA